MKKGPDARDTNDVTPVPEESIPCSHAPRAEAESPSPPQNPEEMRSCLRTAFL